MFRRRAATEHINYFLKQRINIGGLLLKLDVHSKSLDFKLTDGTTQKITVTLIASRTPPISMMPPMLGILAPEEIRDVVAYLSGLKPKLPKTKSDKVKK